jgi:hypothetical protein
MLSKLVTFSLKNYGNRLCFQMLLNITKTDYLFVLPLLNTELYACKLFNRNDPKSFVFYQKK